MRNLQNIPTYRKYKHIVQPIYYLYSAIYNINISAYSALYRHMGYILFEYNLKGIHMAISAYKLAYYDVYRIYI